LLTVGINVKAFSIIYYDKGQGQIITYLKVRTVM